MPNILIVEDDPAVRDVMQIALEREGLSVEAVADGEAALKRFRSAGAFDLVLLVGADDYVTKPVSPLEIVSRVRAHLRRQRVDAPDQRLVFPDLVIDLLRRQVWVGENRVDLTAAEFEVLRLLAAHPGWVYSRQQIMEQLWDGEFYGELRTADVHVRNIRRKIETDPKNPRYILTVRGMGYKFAEIA